jgi:lysophospholipase L1-like esterase
MIQQDECDQTVEGARMPRTHCKEESMMSKVSARPEGHGRRRGIWFSGLSWATFALVLAALLIGAGRDAEARGGQQWFTAWGSSQSTRFTTPNLSGSSVRMIVRPTISGNSVRLKLENTLGQQPVVFSAVYVGKQDAGAAVVPGTNKQVTFGGSAGLTLAAGAGAYSDPIKFKVDAFETYAVSIDVTSAPDISSHFLGLASNYMIAGVHASDPSAGGYVQVPDNNTSVAGATWPLYWVAALDVESPSTTGTVVLFGDSITDGRCSTRTDHGALTGVVQKDVYQRWGDILAERLSVLPANQSKAIANEGIAGNRILSGGTGPTALSRMDRDVLDRQGVTHVVLFLGTNDIVGSNATATQVIDGTQQIIDRAHNAGLKVIGVTIIPRGSASGFTSFMEQQRLAVNAWMRTQANFDGIIDFAELMKGPIVPSNGAEEILPNYSCYDGVHPNDSGYAAMGEYINLGLFPNQAGWSKGH